MTRNVRAAVRIEYSVVISLCRHAAGLSRLPTAEELSRWASLPKGRDLFPDGLTVEQAAEILAKRSAT